VADLLKDVSIEPLGKEQDAFLVACRTEASAFTRVSENRLVVAAAASKTGEATMKVTAVKVFTQNLADDLAPGILTLSVRSSSLFAVPFMPTINIPNIPIGCLTFTEGLRTFD